MMTPITKKSDEPASLERLKASALRMLSRRDHSSHELHTKLKQKYRFEPQIFEELVSYLNKYNYLVSETVLATRLSVAWRSEGRGQYWIKNKLKTKGLPVGEIKGAENKDELEIASALIFLSRKLRNMDETKKLSFEEKAKLTRKLVARGFSYEIAAKALRSLFD
jgi:SOS response regulatory protein OraA/RecX